MSVRAECQPIKAGKRKKGDRTSRWGDGGWVRLESPAGEGISYSAQHMAAYGLNSDRFWENSKGGPLGNSMNVLSFNLSPKLRKRQKGDEAKTKAIQLKKAKKDLGLESQERVMTGQQSSWFDTVIVPMKMHRSRRWSSVFGSLQSKAGSVRLSCGDYSLTGF